MSRGNSREATGKFSWAALALMSSGARSRLLIICANLLDTRGDLFALFQWSLTYQPLWLFQTVVGDHDRAMSHGEIERFAMATIAS
jgi:FPC/CPF motif-containing protein YcgG